MDGLTFRELFGYVEKRFGREAEWTARADSLDAERLEKAVLTLDSEIDPEAGPTVFWEPGTNEGYVVRFMLRHRTPRYETALAKVWDPSTAQRITAELVRVLWGIQPWGIFRTPFGRFATYREAVERCKAADLDPELCVEFVRVRLDSDTYLDTVVNC